MRQTPSGLARGAGCRRFGSLAFTVCLTGVFHVEQRVLVVGQPSDFFCKERVFHVEQRANGCCR